MSKDKRVVAAQLIYEAVEEYKNAESDIDYIKSILLSGAAIYIVSPLVVQEGNKVELSREKRAETSVRFATYIENRELSNSEVAEIKRRSRINIRHVYNSLKHTGNPYEGISALDDLELDANYQEEAEQLIWDAIDDFNWMNFENYHELPEKIKLVLNCGDPMGNLPTFVCRERQYS